TWTPRVCGPARSSPRSPLRATSGRPNRSTRTTCRSTPTATPATSRVPAGSSPSGRRPPERWTPPDCCGGRVFGVGRGAAERARSGQGDAERGDAAHVEPGRVRRPDHAQDDLFAGGTAGDESRGPVVETQGRDRAGAGAARAAGLGAGDVDGEDLAQRAGQRVPVRVVVLDHVAIVHRQPPVGPNRSVLILRAAWPRASSTSAAVSTNPVGPQTK